MSEQILAIQAIIVNSKGQVLLRQRVKGPDAGKWQLAAGHVEPGERLVEAVARHIKSKVGIEEIEKIEFTGHYYDDPNRHPRDYCIPLSFKVYVPTNTTVKDKDKEARWFLVEELKKLEFAFDNKQSLIDLQII